MNTYDPKYHQKSKAISSAEPNYLSQFEMRYPVVYILRSNVTLTNYKLKSSVNLDVSTSHCSEHDR